MIDINKIIQIESSGNPNAVNEKSGAIGLMQITQSALNDYNKMAVRYNKQVFCLSEMINPNFNKIVGDWYINERIPAMIQFYKIPDCDFFRIITYNWGIGHLVDWYDTLPSETRKYLQKYEGLK